MSDAHAIPWDRFSSDPREPSNAPLRASDSDRDVALEVLSGSYADGRVDREEYDERSTTLTAAKTLGDLLPPIRDLAPERAGLVASSPDTLQARAEEKYAGVRATAFATFFGPSLICWVIWAVAGFGFPWPIFVSLGTFTRIAQVLASKRSIIAEEKRKIEKAERRAIEQKPR